VADIAIGNETTFKFTPDGVRTTFVSGVGGGQLSVACDSAGNLFMAVRGTGVIRQGQHGDGYIDKFTPTAVRTRFASHLNAPAAVAIDNSNNLFLEDGAAISSDETKYYPGAIYKFTPNGHQTTFAPGFDIGNSLAWH
jgi:sugar lactone lactonase YvrE